MIVFRVKENDLCLHEINVRLKQFGLSETLVGEFETNLARRANKMVTAHLTPKSLSKGRGDLSIAPNLPLSFGRACRGQG
jgi:hypothetical protein